MNIKKRLCQFLSVMILIIFTLSPPIANKVNAYSWKTCHGKLKWNKNWTNMYISTASFPAGSSWDTRFQSAMWHWNNIKGCRFNFYVGRDTDGTHRSGNGVNEVYLDNALSGSVLAVTRTRYHCYWLWGWRRGIDETDIGFNNNKSWSTGSFNYNNLGSPYNFELIALHELGHALGLKHENRWMATMNSYYPNSGTLGHWKECDPLADDRQGARYLYPDGTTESDIAGSAFRRTGSGSSGLVSSPLHANRGSTITIQFTFSNQSTATKSFNIGFYLSTNSYISKYDTLLGTNHGAWGSPGFTGTFTRTLYIPTSINPRTYYLGFLVDNNNAISENDEGNNQMEMPRKIEIH